LNVPLEAERSARDDSRCEMTYEKQRKNPRKKEGGGEGSIRIVFRKGEKEGSRQDGKEGSSPNKGDQSQRGGKRVSTSP